MLVAKIFATMTSVCIIVAFISTLFQSPWPQIRNAWDYAVGFATLFGSFTFVVAIVAFIWGV